MSPNEFNMSRKGGFVETVEYDKDGMMILNDQDTYFPIAIVGIGLRMPGCESPVEFTDMLLNEKTAIDFIPEHRWGTDDFYHPDNTRKGRYSTTKMAFTEKYHHYDAPYFGHSKTESQLLDPQQRQLLECTEMTMDDAGIFPENIPEDTGVYIGMGMIDWPGTLVENTRIFEESALYGTSHSTTANLLSSRYGLTGPSVAVDTACAASLTAVHVAAMSIWNGECNWALAGATSNLYSPETSVAFSKLGVLSSNGNSAPFDRSNNGYVRGEGTGMILMKPLDQAIKDNDMIYCCIRFTASAHNGYSKSLTLPSADAQVHLIEKCYEHSGIPRSIISFVEAHGTGTPVGDPIETEALGRSLGFHRKDVLPISSGKSTFGHLEVCAGMVQIVKATIMLKNRMLYKQINWSVPHSKINFQDLNLKIQLETLPYDRQQKFVIAVNSFGFGGSIVHMVFEEYSGTTHPKLMNHKLANWKFDGIVSKDKQLKNNRYVIMVLSAKCPKALRDTARNYLKWTNTTEDASVVSSWLASRRRHYEYRLPIITNSDLDFRSQLREFLGDESINIQPANINEKKKTIFIYPGWGQQYKTMGMEYYNEEMSFREEVRSCDDIYKSLKGYSAIERYNLFTENADIVAGCKPAIFFYQMGKTALMKKQGIIADIHIGSGLGDVVASYASGRLSREQSVRLIILRMVSPAKEEFISSMTEIIGNSSVLNSDNDLNLFSATGINTSIMDADYWFKNVTTKPNLVTSIAEILSNLECRVNFVEVAAKSIISTEINDGVTLVPAHLGSDFIEAKLEEESSDIFCDLQQISGFLKCGYKGFDWVYITNNCARHVDLPMYAWQHELTMYESHEYTGRRTGLASRSFVENKDHISKDIFDYLQDYDINGEGMLPASAQLEYMSEVDDRYLTSMRNIHMSPIYKMPGTDEDGFHKLINIESKISNGFIKLVGPNDNIISSATLEYNISRGKRRQLDLASVEERCNKIMTHREIYDDFMYRGMQYGIDFKLVDCVRYNNIECISDLKFSLLRHERIHSTLLDASFQAISVAFAGDTPTTLYLASSIDRLDMHVASLNRKERFRVYSRLVSRSLAVIVVDITICDLDGNTNVDMFGVQFISQVEHPENQLGCYKEIVQNYEINFDLNIEQPVKDILDSNIELDYRIEDIKHLESVLKDPLYNIPSKSSEILSCELKLLKNDDSMTLDGLPACVQMRKSMSKLIIDSIRRILHCKEIFNICIADDYDEIITRNVSKEFSDEIREKKLRIISTKECSSIESVNNELTNNILKDVLDLNSETCNFISGFFDLVIYAGTPVTDYLVPEIFGDLVNSRGQLIFSAVTKHNEFIDKYYVEHEKDWKVSLEKENFDYKLHSEINTLGMSLVIANKKRIVKGSLDGLWACYSSKRIADGFSSIVNDNCIIIDSMDKLDTMKYDKLLYVPDIFMECQEACKLFYDVVMQASNSKLYVILINDASCQVTIEALVNCASRLSSFCDLYYALIGDDSAIISNIKRVIQNENPLDRFMYIDSSSSINVKRVVENKCKYYENWILENDTPKEIPNIYTKYFTTEVACRINEHISLICGGNKLLVSDRIRGKFTDETVSSSYMAYSLVSSLVEHATIFYALNEIRSGADVLFISNDSVILQAAIEIAHHRGIRLMTYTDELSISAIVNSESMVTVHTLNSREILRLSGGTGVDAIIIDTGNSDDIVVDTRMLNYAGRIFALGENGIETSNICNGEFNRLSTNNLDYQQWCNVCEQLTLLYEKGVVTTIENDDIEFLSESLKSGTFANLRTYKIGNMLNSSGKLKLDCNSSYILLGGEGGFDAESIDWLVNNGSREILILADINYVDKWEGTLIISAIKNAESKGCLIHKCSVNVNNISEVKSVINKLKSGLKGIFAMGCFSLDNMEEYKNMIINVNKCTESFDLNYFMTCIASFPPSDTITWAVLKSKLQAITSSRINGTCVQLGRIRAVLDIDEEITFDKGMHVRDVLSTLSDFLSSSDNRPGCITIANIDWSELCNLRGNLQIEHLRGARDVVQEAGISKFELAEERMCAMLRDMLMVDITTLATDRPLTSYGVDSMMSTDIAGWAEKNYGLPITQADVFGGLCIQQLRDQIQASLC